MIKSSQRDLTHDLFLPTLLFAALGGMTWAVRGCSGFGAVAGCIFAGVTWGAAWWFIAHEPTREQSRRYASGWIVLALTVGIGIAGARGWMQWPSFFEGRLNTNYAKNEFVPISKIYGFVWLFIAGVPWAGLGACMLAWCGSIRETRVWHWVIRLACGLAAATLARYLFDTFPQYFLPLYESIESKYKDLETNPTLKRLINDSGSAMYHLGLYLGFLGFEAVRREWKNVVLILTVGLVNGAGWALCQNWKWAPEVWPDSTFNFWRCWESSGGISIGIALGIAYFLVNRKMPDKERAMVAARRSLSGPNFEWLLVFFGLTWFLGLYLRFQMGGWGSYYFSIVLLFGLVYYLANRGTTINEPPRRPSLGRMFANIEWGAIALTIALVAPLFITNREFLRYLLGYLAAVIALGIGWFLLQRKTFEAEKFQNTPADGDPNLERLGLRLGLLLGLGLSLRNGLKGWFNIYKGDEDYWSRVIWQYLGPVYLAILIAIVVCVLFWPVARNFAGRLFPHAYGQMWLVLIVQNIIAQLVTGPLSQWNEMAFSIYYLLLFATTAVIVYHYHFARESMCNDGHRHQEIVRTG